ncbi:MAG: hypothetical protein HKL96_12255 [Phycisphaerales bacterium]|nr:hypothetical protein [Phycisphaerales bacterium]
MATLPIILASAHSITVKELLTVRLPSSFPQSLARLLFENHWLLWGGLCIAAAALTWRGLTNANVRLRNVGAFAVLAVIAWVLVALLVQTPRERLIACHENLVEAAQQKQTDIIIRELSPDVRFGRWNFSDIQRTLAQRLASINITHNYIRLLKVHITGQTAVSNMNVWTDTRNFGGPIISYWRFHWQDQPAPGNWRMTQIQLLRINNTPMPPGSVLPSPH